MNLTLCSNMYASHFNHVVYLFHTSVCIAINHWWACSFFYTLVICMYIYYRWTCLSYSTLVICMSVKQWWASSSGFTLVICMSFQHWWAISYCFPQVFVCLLNRDDQVHTILVLVSECSDELIQTHRQLISFTLPYMNTHTDRIRIRVQHEQIGDSRTRMHQMNRHQEVAI